MKIKSCSNLAKVLTIILTLSFFCIFNGSTKVIAADGENIGRLSHLVTSNNPDNYAVIDVNGDTVTARGKYASDIPNCILISGAQSTSNTFKLLGGREFTAELTCKPLENGYYKFYISFNSDAAMSYLMMYDDQGWHIPDNNLSVLNAEKLDNIRQTEPIAAAYYISPTGDKAEIKETMEKIQTIANQVCDGVEDDYQKAYLLNRWIADNIYYDHDAADTEVTIETVALSNVLENHRTTCAGYANLFCALLEVEGIRSVNLKGAAVAGDVTYETLTTDVENHEFTAFWYEEQNRWAYVDSCWSGAGDYKNGQYSERITYDKYFDVTGEAFALNHRVDKVEERFYTKALAAVEANEATQILQTGEATKDENSDVTNSDNTLTTDKSEQTDNIPIGDSKPVTDGKNENPSNKENENITPYIIIGVVGVMAVITGIILAVNKYKKNK